MGRHAASRYYSWRYAGPRTSSHSRNLPSSFKQPEVIDAELAKERAAGRVLGPFATPPLPRLHCSGLGAVPKKDGRWRMILHLSAPAGKSVNDYIDRDQYSLHYSSVDDAVQILLTLGPGALMAKVDLKSAFRMIPVHPADWELLGMQWRGHYYIDTCLPFGLQSAPSLFNQVAIALEWVLKNNYAFPHLIHYLDDFFIAGPAADPSCARQLQCFLRVAAQLGVRVAMEKVEGPSTTLTLLGLLLDSTRQEISLPPAKLSDILQELDLWSTRRSTTKRELLSLIGKLAFAARDVPAGRLFLRRLISLSTCASHLHHHIRLNAEARADIAWWQAFLPTWNGTAKFISPLAKVAADIELYTDASGTLGCGAYYRGAWFHYAWQPHQHSHSIQWKELFAIVTAALTWGPSWTGSKIRFHCDNLAIVLAWEAQRCKQLDIMALLRTLFFAAASYNYHVPHFSYTWAN